MRVCVFSNASAAAAAAEQCVCVWSIDSLCAGSKCEPSCSRKGLFLGVFAMRCDAPAPFRCCLFCENSSVRFLRRGRLSFGDQKQLSHLACCHLEGCTMMTPAFKSPQFFVEFHPSLEATDTPRARSISVRPHAVGRHPDRASMSRGGLIKEVAVLSSLTASPPQNFEQKRQNPKHADRRAASFIPYRIFVFRLDPFWAWLSPYGRDA